MGRGKEEPVSEKGPLGPLVGITLTVAGLGLVLAGLEALTVPPLPIAGKQEERRAAMSIEDAESDVVAPPRWLRAWSAPRLIASRGQSLPTVPPSASAPDPAGEQTYIPAVLPGSGDLRIHLMEMANQRRTAFPQAATPPRYGTQMHELFAVLEGEATDPKACRSAEKVLNPACAPAGRARPATRPPTG